MKSTLLTDDIGPPLADYIGDDETTNSTLMHDIDNDVVLDTVSGEINFEISVERKINMSIEKKKALFLQFEDQIVSTVVNNVVEQAASELNLTAIAYAIMESYATENNFKREDIGKMSEEQQNELLDELYAKYGEYMIARYASAHRSEEYRAFVTDVVRDQLYNHIEEVSSTATENWYRYLSPWWSWDAWRAFSVLELGITELQDKVGHLVDAWERASGAGWWWPHSDFVVMTDRPTIISRERIGPDGWNSHQLHSENGPSMQWRDDWALYHWHGTQVTDWVINDLTIDKITAETNTEIRRCAIERFGWDNYIEHIGSDPIDVADDPGNPGHTLHLYEVPDDLYEGEVRLLIMKNASRDRDGSRRTFAETVPSDINTALAAAAWQFDIDVETYKDLARAT